MIRFVSLIIIVVIVTGCSAMENSARAWRERQAGFIDEINNKYVGMSKADLPLHTKDYYLFTRSVVGDILYETYDLKYDDYSIYDENIEGIMLFFENGILTGWTEYSRFH